ncbi:MAG: phosphate acetyltransferase [Deltaproteobacteria bacterium]|jgi:phosphate acetyltransferase|nr:phosphate acetyltransferase [Deltaproteobacteria bacterium]
MASNLYITPTEAQTGKSSVVLGLMQLLLQQVRTVAFFRPIIGEPVLYDRDHDINLVLQHFKLSQPYPDTFAYTLDEARALINSGQRTQLLENILEKFRRLSREYDFVLCEGTDFVNKDMAFEFELNADIASNLGCAVMLVGSGAQKSVDEILTATQSTIDLLEEKGLDLVSVVVNRASVTAEERQTISEGLHCKRSADPLVYVLPEDAILAKPTMEDVRKWLDAQVLYGHGYMDTLVGDYLIAAMQVHNFLDHITGDNLIITPGDRVDIILAALTTRLSSAYPDISGILLTGGLSPTPNVRRLIEGWIGVPVPILLAKQHTYKTIQSLSLLYGRIDPSNARKVNTALGTFEKFTNKTALSERLIGRVSTKVTPVMFEFGLIERAKSDKMRIVLPEGEEERILRAADILRHRDVVDIILLGDANRIGQKISHLGLEMDGVTILQPEHAPQFQDYVDTYAELRKQKGISPEQARDRMLDVACFGTMMVYKNHADGMVSGAINTTAHTIRPALEFVKTKPGFSVVSGSFLMCLKDRVLVFADCAVNPNPTAQQLAEIAVSTAATAKAFGIEPRVAMLSYSTGSSGKGEDVDAVVEATRIAKEMAPDLMLEGPLQYDAAIDPEVAKTKLPNSQVAGQATVFIFPDLNTGNNTYKAVQRAAGAVAIGPVLQGLKKPVNDLSRGCTVPDIVNTVAITAIQAQAEKPKEA